MPQRRLADRRPRPVPYRQPPPGARRPDRRLDSGASTARRRVGFIRPAIVAQALASLSYPAQAGLFGPSAGEEAAVIVFVILGIPTLVGGIVYTIVKLAQIRRDAPTPAHTAFQFDIFLSYAEKDHVQAAALAEQLQQSGLKLFFARKDLDAGSAFTDEIREALGASRELWLLATPNSVNSIWVATEWGTAWALKKRIVPILLDTATAELPDRLRALQTVALPEVAREARKALERARGQGAGASEKQRLVAALLCLFFGVLGVHRFYVGKIASGILQVAVGAGLQFVFDAWPPVFLWPLADLFLILIGRFSDKDGERLTHWRGPPASASASNVVPASGARR